MISYIILLATQLFYYLLNQIKFQLYSYVAVTSPELFISYVLAYLAIATYLATKI